MMKSLCVVTVLMGVANMAAPSAACTRVAQDCATCASAKEKDGWCAGCRVGYIKGEKTACKSCFDIRASGKTGWCEGCKVGYSKGVKTSCKSCLAAIEADKWCDGCGVGYANAQKTKCRNCFAAVTSKDGAWCADCKVGYARGLKTTCKSCLSAIQKDGWCDGCGVGYANAQKTKCKNCFAAMKSTDGAWCTDCKVGHARGLKTKCPKCFEAIKSNGACADCGRRFKDGAAYKTVYTHVHAMNSADAAAKAKAAIEKVDGVTNVRADHAKGRLDLDLKESSETKVADVLKALEKAGFDAHEGRE